MLKTTIPTTPVDHESSMESGHNFLLDVEDFPDQPIEQSVAELIDHAVRLGASDLFLCCNEDDVDVTIRHLGIIRYVASLDSDTGNRCIAHTRASAGMKFADRRHPQDGRWTFRNRNGRVTNLRLSSIPSMHGESFAMRLLERDSPLTDIESLGLVGPQTEIMRSLLGNSSGLVIVSGPTGSGKTTTMYACMHHLNDGRRKIHTIEDPIEYGVRGLRQSEADEVNGPKFSELLRGVVRQSPDVIMVGEIRDSVTAETAVLAANSGQLVFVTLHASIAASAIHSMLSLNVPPYFLCTSLLAVISQRLVRTLHPEKKIRLNLTHAPRTFDEVRPYLHGEEGNYIYAADNSQGDEGFVGRTGLFEVMPMSPAIRTMVSQIAPANVIHQRALDEGMIDFRRAALLKVAQGVTSVEELQRVLPSAEFWGEFMEAI